MEYPGFIINILVLLCVFLMGYGAFDQYQQGAYLVAGIFGSFSLIVFVSQLFYWIRKRKDKT